jgi:hypothetical protein
MGHEELDEVSGVDHCELATLHEKKRDMKVVPIISGTNLVPGKSWLNICTILLKSKILQISITQVD